ncbi:MAG: DUF523 domain-containing protein [Sphaerochaetaceae bacterium]|jgi:uncharacterized protein YbbK (DUF523 family)/uncharacterized protein YbgA (DUF1722 family)|nr:DUF523 domain-containing protein [Sphaerochaetaceae bacterium]MDD3942220.1 DUF523 domain-containing protein [Sphaerochaetaceae bacterium]MDX9940220.1 DUF523 domain-containing protein [Sphaerochaetaceae bacterium]
MDKGPVIITEKIPIGISLCCMGSPVRYNGKGIDVLKDLGREKGDFIWCPVCPECMAGLGVPRDPVHLSNGDGDAVWSGDASVRNRGGRDVTVAMKTGCSVCLESLQRCRAVAFVYMDGSPSCGVYRTTLKNQRRGNPPGVFGSLLLREGYFLIPSSDLQSPLRWWDWRRRLLAFHWFSTVTLESMKDVYEAWYRLKFLCQELDDPWARQMGKRLAATKLSESPEFPEEFRRQVSDVLRKPSTTKRITNSLWKHYSHYRKQRGKTVAEVNSPEFRRNMTTIAKELTKMERTAFEDDYLFGASPVIYRDARRLPKPQET